MRSSDLRHTVRLRLTLVGPLPAIWREVAVDRDLSLADLRSIIGAVFDGQTCSHHLFTDNLDSRWTHSRHRWGDRWTMIDLRDPTIIDEHTARIGRVLRETHSLSYGHTCHGGWLVEIEAREDDIVPSSDPPAQILAGERRAPLPCVRSPYEHTVLIGVLRDRDHPEHEPLRAAVEHAVGPWSQFDPEAFDLADTQRRLDALELGSTPRSRGLSNRTTSLSGLVARLPRPARPGLERYVDAMGLDLPVVVTADESREVTREFEWILSRAAEGVRLIDGQVDPVVVRAGTVALDCDSDRVLRLFALAKRARLLYSRSGTLIANRRSAAAAAEPGALWSLLARAVVRTVGPSASGDLFLLSIADGTLADPEIGTRRIVEALALLQHSSRYGDWWPSGMGPGDCEQVCDCPGGTAESWHQIVARAIRAAASVGQDHDGGWPLTAGLSPDEAHDLGFMPEWLDYPAERGFALAVRTQTHVSIDEATVLRGLTELIELLSTLGLVRTDDGVWIVPPILREFARESLQDSARDRGY